ncbi:hypothetical protein BIT28_06260 [Photobacterium proteolyticum]|uniref:HTH lysR-type domain-containing protein n=1 Tax=Photobacterium proteolyticum TaxID=1903952 RepID=A0A1Q9GEG9_9GAMM|nr:hypothetical protein BIT28_06260 [Photobacterium proteolyticum]
MAEAESFTAAAKRLGISTTQVSRQINALEARLAAKLFYRMNRKVSVTDVGRMLVDYLDEQLNSLAVS